MPLYTWSSILGNGYLSGSVTLFNLQKSATSRYSMPKSPFATNSEGAAHSDVQGSMYPFSNSRLFSDPLSYVLQVRPDMIAAMRAWPQVLLL